MAAGDLSLMILLRANDMASSVIRGIGESFGPLGVGMAAIGVAAVAAGATAVKMAGDFQASMTRLVTSAGELPQNLQMISNGILQLSVSTGTSYQQLAAGMYYVESSGYRAANALRVLQVAAQGAKSENADLTTVSKALTTVMTDYHMPVSQAATAMNGLIATVQNGNTNLQLLSDSMGQVLPIASALHISFPQVAGALDTMTHAGMSARQASMNLAHVLVALQAPSGVATKSMKEVGLSAQQVRDALVNQGLPQALQLIEDHVGKKFPEGSVANTTALKNIMGGLVGLKLAAMLTGGSLKETENNIAKVSAAMKNGGQAVMGWSEVQGTFNFKLDQMKSAFDALLITLGTRLLPIVGTVVSGIAGLVGNFTQLISTGGQMSPILSNITGMMGVMASNFRDFGAQVGPLVSGPLQQFGQLMGQLLPGFISQFLRAIDDVQLIFLDVATSISTLVKPALAILGQAFKGVQGFIETALNTIEGQFLPALHNLLTVITPIIQGILQWVASSNILGIVFGILSVAVQIVIGVISFLVNVLAAIINFFANTALGAAIFKAILVILGIAIATIAIIILSVAIPALIGMGIAAITTGIEMVIAFFPIVLIVLAIVAVVTIVILIITHWGAIMAWFGNVFSAVGTFIHGVLSAMGAWFGNVFSAIGTTVRNALTGIKNFFGSAFSAIGTTVHNALTGIGNLFSWLGTQARQKWNDLVNGIKGIVAGIGSWLKNAWQNIVNTVVGWFLWLYNHNYYFKALVDSIINIFTQMKAWVINLWTTVVNWIVEKWTGLKEKTSEIFSAIGTTIRTILTGIKNFFGNIFDWLGTKTHDALTGIKNFFGNTFDWLGTKTRDVLTAIKNFFGNIFSQIGTVVHDKIMALAIWMYGIWEQIKSNVVSKVTDLKNMVGNAFSALGTDVHNKVTGLWNWLVGFANGWPAQAFNWGKNLIQGIINGIMNMIGAVKNAVGQVAGTIGNFLGFHSPAKEGPGREADKWAPAFITMYVAGLHAGLPKVNAALTQLTTPTTNKNAFALQGGSSSGGGSGGYGVMNLQINLDGKVLTEVVSVRMAKETRINGYRSR